ncbi:hypothetical protein HMPREF1002_04508 [Porphyromonas sp. 31_2]|nr:hypothetical protein HMPREF1002_04508 [Porphyromonas sp. 31_2]
MNKRNTIKQLLHRRCLLMGICAITSSAFAWDFAEHRKIGDRAMSLLPRYLVENGIFPTRPSLIAPCCRSSTCRICPARTPTP